MCSEDTLACDFTPDKPHPETAARVLILLFLIFPTIQLHYPNIQWCSPASSIIEVVILWRQATSLLVTPNSVCMNLTKGSCPAGKAVQGLSHSMIFNLMAGAMQINCTGGLLDTIWIRIPDCDHEPVYGSANNRQPIVCYFH